MVHPRRRHIFFTEPFPEIPGPVPLTTDRASGFYFRKELEQMLLSPGDVEDVGDDLAVAVDRGKIDCRLSRRPGSPAAGRACAR